jgi:hypothetical protein
MDACVLCFEDMDMMSYQDERESTQTCVKLDCGHAFHTQCIVRCLSQAERKCPQCNSNKDPEQTMTEEGIAIQYVSEIKKDERMRMLFNELKEAREECGKAIAQLKKETREYAESRKKELQVDEKRKYMIDCLGELRRVSREVAKDKGSKYMGALKYIYDSRTRYYAGTSFEKYFLGKQAAYGLYRLKHPGVYIHLY